jgi:acetyltransferase-like isoleucine patch superfamily enzyme
MGWNREIPVGRIVKSLRNRARLGAMRLRGDATRRFSFGSVRAGKRLLIGQNVRLILYGELVLGDDVVLSDGCTLEVGPGARVVLGDGVFVGRNAVIAAHGSIEIGDRVLIAEHCSIRDQDHHVDPDERQKETEALTDPVILESNVWLGAGVRILRGCRIGSGAVVAANAVVREDVPPRMVAGGIPARILGPAARNQVGRSE